MKYLFVLTLLFSTIGLSQDSSKRTVFRAGGMCGKSCQVCVTNGVIKVCKFYKKCPEKKPKECRSR